MYVGGIYGALDHIAYMDDDYNCVEVREDDALVAIGSATECTEAMLHYIG